MGYNIFANKLITNLKNMRVKTGREFTENIVMGIFFAGVITFATPYFAVAAIPKIIKLILKNKKDRQAFCNTFYKLKKRGLIKISNRNGQIYISLTKEGKKKAGKYQINNLKIKKPKKWDKKWRILIFDIQEKHRIKRDALRGKIKELKLFKLQDSVWAHPFDFHAEIDLLRSFFGLTPDELQIITAEKIENDKKIKLFFGLK